MGGNRSDDQASGESNRLSDFPPDQFTIRLFFDACGHRADLDREKVPAVMAVQELRRHLRCTDCGSGECSLRIVYAGAGEFRHA